ncbi:hypothetical protein AGMMS49959_04680 [Planctomycetales bacterium]|nr:hypothetical protein AGMMS49959_04680 [Planctomycetales bacterium]
MLLNLVRKSFTQFFEIILWIILVGSALSGLVTGAAAYGFLGGLGGLIFGAVYGALTIVVLGGVVSVFLKMASDVEKLAAAKNPAEAPSIPAEKTGE